MYSLLLVPALPFYTVDTDNDDFVSVTTKKKGKKRSASPRKTSSRKKAKSKTTSVSTDDNEDIIVNVGTRIIFQTVINQPLHLNTILNCTYFPFSPRAGHFTNTKKPI